MDDAHKQRQAVSPGDGEHEGTVQNEVHFLIRRGGCAAHHHNGIGRGGDAFLVNGHAGGVLLLPSEHFTRFGNPAWPGVRTANFAAFGSWSEVLPKNAESLRDSDALMRVNVPRRRSPAGLRDPASALWIMW